MCITPPCRSRNCHISTCIGLSEEKLVCKLPDCKSARRRKQGERRSKRFHQFSTFISELVLPLLFVKSCLRSFKFTFPLIIDTCCLSCGSVFFYSGRCYNARRTKCRLLAVFGYFSDIFMGMRRSNRYWLLPDRYCVNGHILVGDVNGDHKQDFLCVDHGKL